MANEQELKEAASRVKEFAKSVWPDMTPLKQIPAALVAIMGKVKEEAELLHQQDQQAKESDSVQAEGTRE